MRSCQVNVHFRADDLANHFSEISIPPELSSSIKSRKLQYAAGRYCAFQAMFNLGLHPPFELPTGPLGAPIWPKGIAGSITHTKTYARALLVRTSKNENIIIGIDSEAIMDPLVAEKCSRVILTDKDRDLLKSLQLDLPTFVTAVFSIKESLYKALSAQQKIGFRSIHILSLDLEQGNYVAHLANSEHKGTIRIENGMVHSELLEITN